MKNEARFTAPDARLLGDKLKVGEGTWIGFNTLLDAQCDKLTIGENCDISSFVRIYTHSTHLRCVNIGKKIIGPVVLGDCVFVGDGSVILPHTMIEHHSIVGALSKVQGHFPPYSLIAGNPAKLIKRI